MTDIKSLQIFREVARQGSFLAAAHTLNLSLSTISLKIQNLEKFANTKLFDRSQKPPPLTENGISFLKKTETVLKAWDELKPQTNNTLNSQKIRIGSVHTPISTFLPNALNTIRKQFPKLEVTIKIGLSHELEDEIRAGKLDAALVTHPQLQQSELKYITIAYDTLMLIKPKHHQEENVSTLLKTQPIVRFSPHARVGKQIDTIIKKLTTTTPKTTPPITTMQIDSLESVMALVGAGLGVAIVPIISTATCPHNITTLPLPQTLNATRTLALATPTIGAQNQQAEKIASILIDEAQKY